MLKYDSGMTAAALITQLKSEADISYPITDASWVMWLNTVEQLLYGEIADDLRVVSYESSASYGSFDLGNITVSADCRDVRFDDIDKFYVDDEELIKVSAVGGKIFTGRQKYWPDGSGNISYTTFDGTTPDVITVAYRAAPELKSGVSDTAHVFVPAEFLGLVSSFLRGQAYMLANEDTLAAKWIGDYNSQLADFTAWCQKRNTRFGE